MASRFSVGDSQDVPMNENANIKKRDSSWVKSWWESDFDLAAFKFRIGSDFNWWSKALVWKVRAKVQGGGLVFSIIAVQEAGETPSTAA